MNESDASDPTMENEQSVGDLRWHGEVLRLNQATTLITYWPLHNLHPLPLAIQWFSCYQNLANEQNTTLNIWQWYL